MRTSNNNMALFDERLIRAVSEYDFLYNQGSRGNSNRIRRDSTWAKIALQLGKKVQDCRQRWRSLRDRYVREKKRLENSEDADAADGEVWEFYESLKFLNESVRHRNRQSEHYERDNESYLEAPVFSTDDTSFNFTEHSTPEPVPAQSPKGSRLDGDSFNFTDCSTPDPVPTQPAKRSRLNDDETETLKTEYVDDLSKMLPEHHLMVDDGPDENDLFMQMIAKKMKILPLGVKMRLQEQFLQEVNSEILLNTRGNFEIAYVGSLHRSNRRRRHDKSEEE